VPTPAQPPKVADTIVRVTERRRRLLSDAERAALDATDSFWTLVDAGYISLRRSGARRYEIVGHKYVGRAITGDVETVVAEKAQGTLRALIAAATGSELRIWELGAPATEFDVISRHLMRQFIQAAGRYVAERREARYEYELRSGPVLAGSLDIARTIRVHASGRRHHFAFSSGRVIRDEPLDRVVLAAIDELDRAATALRLDRDTLYDARWLAGALEEIRDERFLSLVPSDYLGLADVIQHRPETIGEDRDLARLAAVALLHRGFEAEREVGGSVPRAWFIDLETLFEQAVRETLRELLDGHEVDRGENLDRWMFTGGADRSRTNPDVVIQTLGLVRAVGDVKYKTLRAALEEIEDEEETAGERRTKEGRPDIYQLLVHAASLDAELAFLVFVSDDEYISRYLGTAATGCRTWTAQVRPAHLRDDLARFAAEMSLVMPKPDELDVG
jgi:McrBC 5-methylcytosine restriction system component